MDKIMTRIASLIRLWFPLFLAVLLITSCNKAPGTDAQRSSQVNAAKRYHLKGKVVSVDVRAKMANIDSEAIPGFMDAMTMPYRVKPESDLGNLRPGDVIVADVVVQDESAWLENVTVTTHGHQ
jgi:protein SCO1/2